MLEETYPLHEQLGNIFAEHRSLWERLVGPRIRSLDAMGLARGGSLFSLVNDIRSSEPGPWAEVEMALRQNASYRAASDKLAALTDETRSASDGVAAVADGGPWPSGYVVRQFGGSRRWPAFADLLGGLPVVDHRFVDALQSAGCTGGWRTVDAELRDRRGRPVQTHAVLVVTGRAYERRFTAGHDRDTRPAKTRDRQQPALVRMVDRRHPERLPTPDVCASPAAAHALRTAGVAGVELEPILAPVVVLDTEESQA